MNENRKWSVKCDSVTVWIRLQQPTKANPHYRCYTLDFTEDGRRHRPSCSTLKQAKKEAKTAAQRLSRGDTGNLVLTGNARLECTRALESLAPMKVSLDVAAADFAKTPQLLNGSGSLLDAARYYATTHSADMFSIATRLLVDDLLRTREAVRLGVGAFETVSGHVVNVALVCHGGQPAELRGPNPRGQRLGA